MMLVYASGQCMEQRSCGCSQLWHSAPPGMTVGCCELRLRSTPRYRLVCICFPTPGRGLPYGSGLGLSRCLGPGECLNSFIHSLLQLVRKNNQPGIRPFTRHPPPAHTLVPDPPPCPPPWLGTFARPRAPYPFLVFWIRPVGWALH